MTREYTIDVSNRRIGAGDPCQDCEHKELCGTQHKACERFAMYTFNGRIDTRIPKDPTFTMYYRLMEIEDDEAIQREINKKMKKEIA